MSKAYEAIQELVNTFSRQEYELFMQNRGPYILTKAWRFLELGPEQYRQEDAFNYPPESCSPQDMEWLRLGCKQLLEGKGLTSEKPLTGIGVRGCHLLFKLFHFDMASQRAEGKANGSYLDEMVFRHIMDETDVTYYNLV